MKDQSDKAIYLRGRHMAGDIKLKSTGVEVVGNLEVGQITPPNRQLKVEGWDFILDCKERRGPETVSSAGITVTHSQQRRALVHDVGDRLTINYGVDYPGGVNIPGHTLLQNLDVKGHITAPVAKLLGYSWFGSPKSITCFAQDLVLANLDKDKDAPLKNVALSHMPGDKLVINRAKGYSGGVEMEGPVNISDELKVQNMDLVAEIKQLRAELNALKKKLA